MRSKVRIRLATLGVAIALAAVTVFVVLPVFGTSHPDADRLRLTPDTEAFYYGAIDATSPDVTDFQPVTVGNKGCEINPLDGSLVTLSSDGGGRVKDPGLVDHGIGVKSGGSNGTPCSLTDEFEKLIIASKSSWYKLELDIEAKGDAWIHAELRSGGAAGTLVETYQLLTGTSIDDYNALNDPDEEPVDSTAPYVAVADSGNLIEACANQNDSGPDNIYFDNCRWIITSDYRFDTVVLYTSVGSVALMGGSDFETFDPTGFDAGTYDSLFYRAPAPTALDDAYSTNEDTLRDVDAPGILSNDDDPFGGVLTAVPVDSTSNGDLTLNADGSFTYDPDADFNGTDTFTYQASAGAEPSEIATVTITVNAVNDPPEAKGTPLSATEDTLATYSVDELAFDPDGDMLTVDSAFADNPDATVTFDDEKVFYTSALNSCESDTLNFTVSDGNGGFVSDSVTINITCVNDAPVADDDSYETNERDAIGTLELMVAAPGVLEGDTDADDDTLTVTGATTPSEGGTVTDLGLDGSFDYSPSGSYPWAPGEFSYDETWDYIVSDGVLTDTGTVTITVFRVICSDETVSDKDGDIEGSFTLLTLLPDCKRYEVDADAGAEVITFSPGGGNEAFFRGELSFFPQTLDVNGTFFIGLVYDPDNDGPEPFKTVQVCIDPIFDGDGLVTSATIPVGETWCFAGALSLASATDPGEIVTVSQVYGKEDPGFGFR